MITRMKRAQGLLPPEEDDKYGYLWIGLKTVSATGNNYYLFPQFDVHLFSPTSDEEVSKINSRELAYSTHYMTTNGASTISYTTVGRTVPHPSSEQPAVVYPPVNGIRGPGVVQLISSEDNPGATTAGLRWGSASLGRYYSYGTASLVSPDDSWQKCIIIDEKGNRHPMRKLPTETVTWFDGTGHSHTRDYVLPGKITYRGLDFDLRTRDNYKVYLDDSRSERLEWETPYKIKSGKYLVKLNSHFVIGSGREHDLQTPNIGPVGGVIVVIGIQTRWMGPVTTYRIPFYPSQWASTVRDQRLFGEAEPGWDHYDTRPGELYPSPSPPYYDYGPNTMNWGRGGWWEGGIYINTRRHTTSRPRQWNAQEGAWEDVTIVPPFGFEPSAHQTKKRIASRVFYYGPMRAFGTGSTTLESSHQYPPYQIRGHLSVDLTATELGGGGYSDPWATYRVHNDGSLATEAAGSFMLSGGLSGSTVAGAKVHLHAHYANGFDFDSDDYGGDMDRIFYSPEATPLITPWSSEVDEPFTGARELGLMNPEGILMPISVFVADTYPYPSDRVGPIYELTSGAHAASPNGVSNRQIYPEGSQPTDPYEGTCQGNGSLNSGFLSQYEGALYEDGLESMTDIQDNYAYAVLTESLFDGQPINRQVAYVHDDYYELEGNESRTVIADESES